MASWKDKLKKASAKAGGFVIKAVKYGAPVVGTLLGGPIGGAAATAVAALAATHRAKNKKAAVTRALAYGGAVTGAGLAINAISGQNLLSPLTGLFKSGSPAAVNGAAAPGETNPNAHESLVDAAMQAANLPTATAGQVGDRPGVIGTPIIAQQPGQPGQGTDATQQGMGSGALVLLAVGAFFLLRR